MCSVRCVEEQAKVLCAAQLLRIMRSTLMQSPFYGQAAAQRVLGVLSKFFCCKICFIFKVGWPLKRPGGYEMTMMLLI
jgi:hypothetical protein